MLADSQAAWQSLNMSERRETSLLYLLKRVEMGARRRLDVVVEAAGVTAVQYAALSSLEQQPGLTAAALARHSFVKAQTTAQLVRGLVDRGFIVRLPDPTSRRQVILELTPSGLELLQQLREPVAAIASQMTAGVGPEDLEQARWVLESFRHALEA